MARPVDASTLEGKFLFGFQGWFACPADANTSGNWNHWFKGNGPSVANTTFEQLPDVQEFPAAGHCPTDLKNAEGKNIDLFSDQNYETVLEQFKWMQKYNLDGVVLQRFVVSIGDSPRLALSNRVLDNVKRAAEATGRVFFVEYDSAGVKSAEWRQTVKADWLKLLHESGIASSPAYMHHRGRLLVGLTGPGLHGDKQVNAADTQRLLGELRDESGPWGGVTTFATVPRDWRTDTAFLDGSPSWLAVFRSFDVISPWLVGNYKEDADVDHFVQARLKPDLAEANRLGIDYMPVVFPGFSWANLKDDPGQSNKIPRRCGRFAWKQATAFRAAGAKMLFGAMFDEVDEGTAWFKLSSDHVGANQPGFLALDADGCKLPSDWYLRVAAQITLLVHGQEARFPELR